MNEGAGAVQAACAKRHRVIWFQLRWRAKQETDFALFVTFCVICVETCFFFIGTPMGQDFAAVGRGSVGVGGVEGHGGHWFLRG